MSEEQEYDVVVDVLSKHRAQLMKMTTDNLKVGELGLMDDIRFAQIEEIDKCLKMWKASGG